MLLFSFLSAIVIVAMPPKGWQPVPQCVTASVASGPRDPSKLLSHSNVDTDLRADLPRPFLGVPILSFGVRFWS